MPFNSSLLDPQTPKKRLIFFSAIAASLVVALFTLILTLASYRNETVDVLVPRGKSLGQVAEILHQQGIIKHPTLFKLLLRFTGGTTRVRAGEYRFQKGMSSFGALLVLYQNEPVLHQITVPEGYTIRQIAKVLADNKLIDEQKFLKLALSPEGAQKYGLKTPHLEGFLFPDTYGFALLEGEDRILDRMVQRFLAEYEKSFKKEAEAKGWTMERLVTLASIIEKETGAPEERPLVSSVFHNRLKKRMKLQSDPTTIYGIPNFSGNLHKADLLRHTPYNTYTIPALPPGPIASPGFEALHAALNPAKSDYLYFVAKEKGRHVFSNTYSQHARNVNSFQVTPFRNERLKQKNK